VEIFPHKNMCKLLGFGLNSLEAKVLCYCATAWGSAKTAHLKPINEKQTNILHKIALSSYDAHVSPIYKLPNFLKYIF